MSQDRSRRAPRIAFSTKALLKGSCGAFDASVEDISLTGIRLRIAREVLRLQEEADLAEAAACVQTRIGSRFVTELQASKPGLCIRKKVDLVRLVLPGQRPHGLDLGCMFGTPLSPSELQALDVTLPAPPAAAGDVRQTMDWADAERPPLDPGVTAEKVEHLFGVEADRRPAHPRLSPQGALGAVLTAAAGSGTAPLVCGAESFTESTVVVRIDGTRVTRWRAAGADVCRVLARVVEEYGEWPHLELISGSRRVWRGAAHVYGVEISEAPSHDVLLCLAFHRRLGREELARVLAA